METGNEVDVEWRLGMRLMVILLPPQVRVGATVITEELGHGTIQPAANFDPEADAVALRKATKKHGECVREVYDVRV